MGTILQGTYLWYEARKREFKRIVQVACRQRLIKIPKTLLTGATRETPPQKYLFRGGRLFS